MSDAPPKTTLANCEDEPIHLPGAVQPYGALLAVSMEGMVLSRSSNFLAITGFDAAVGATPPRQMGSSVFRLISDGIAAGENWSDSAETLYGRQRFDVIAHVYRQVLYLELEPRLHLNTSINRLAFYAQRIIGQMQRHNDAADLIDRATQEIRQLTGFDRVMAYRFRPDLSGEVIAEARKEGLPSYLGQRYPASDIPAQARLLYIQNPIRMISDVAYEPAALEPRLNPQTGQPFDLSFCALRSVSPIHCEYLTNMGVRASMSVSIVVAGKLWGLFSCHHLSPLVVPYPVRMSFQVISQVSSALVERLEHTQATETLHRASELRNRLLQRCRDSEDLLAALCGDDFNIAEAIACDGAAVALSGRTQSLGGQFGTTTQAVLEHLQSLPDSDLFQTDRWQPGDDESAACGVLAVRFHPGEAGWLLWFRREEIQSVRWGGKPEKITAQGPSGPRLTPRGSFETWEETVRGRAPAWSEIELSIADKLRSSLVEVCLGRAGEIDRMRQRLIAMLGHDLRNPLQSISMAAAMLKSNELRDTELRQHISSSSGRMERLISQILEMSRLQSGLGIPVILQTVDLSALVNGIIHETVMAFPGIEIEVDVQEPIQAQADPDRYAQVITNLLGNARYHGRPGRPISIRLECQPQYCLLTVENEAEPLSAERLGGLFLPFKPQNGNASRNKDGLGLGLYISQAIASAHGGKLEVTQGAGRIAFTLSVPLAH